MTSTNVTNLVGSSTPFVATLPTGYVGANYTWWWGDGSSLTTTTGSDSHAYGTPGEYLVYAQSYDTAGGLHDNLHSLLRHSEIASDADNSLGNYPEIAGSVVGNSTSNVNATAAVAPGQSVTVSNWILTAPTNPEWKVGPPAYALSSSITPYATLSAAITNSSGINGVTVGISSNCPNGSYALTFSVPSESSISTPVQTVWANFTFTLFVHAAAGVPPETIPTSPHRGTLDVYANASFETWDPAISYYGPDSGVLQSVFQTLIFPNVSSPGPNVPDFVPDLATCVPGSSLCTHLYGSYGASFETPGTFTFVVSANASFYNPATGSHIPVWPNDVAFSVARDCLYANPSVLLLPAGEGAGWILCQALLPSGGPSGPNGSWDSGLHAPYNQTPSNILASFEVNDSSYCPASSPMRDGVHGNGCITFFTNASGHSWPEFLDFLATPWGISIESCAWFTSIGLGLPGWESGANCIGAPPGSPGNPNAVPGPTAWDSYYEQSAQNWITSPARWTVVGSGPYYVKQVTLAAGGPSEFQLATNPYWPGTGCIGGYLAGCLPPGTLGDVPPTFIGNVTVFNESATGTAPGLRAAQAGTADLIDVSSSDVGALENGLSSGQLFATVTPTFNERFASLNLNYSPAAADSLFGWTPTLPTTLLQDLNLREFLVHSYPAQTVEQQACTSGGIQFCFQYGGSIPAYMTGYYPTNITWPFSNPNSNASDVGSAAWWWAQAEGDGIVGQYCTLVAPCTFPLPEFNGSTDLALGDPSMVQSSELWAQEIRTLTDGILAPVLVPVNQTELTTGLGTNGPYPVVPLGWLPDYFDASDYTDSAYLPSSLYSSIDDTPSSLLQPAYESACSGPVVDPTVTTACQGTAYAELANLVDQGDSCTLPACTSAQRELFYNMAEGIASKLGLFVPYFQQNEVSATATWIDPTSIPRDPLIGSDGSVVGDPFFDIRYLSVVPPVYPLVVSGLSGLGAPTPPAVASAERLAAFVPTVETGENLLILVGVTGGNGHYLYDWQGLPTGCQSANSGALLCHPTGTGSFTLSVVVTDTVGDRGTSPSATVQVLQGPYITSFTAAQPSVTLGSAVTLQVVAGGGTGGLRYAYSGLPTGCVSANTSQIQCVPRAVGTFSVAVVVSDGLGVAVLNTTTLTVTSPTPGPSPATGIPLLWAVLYAAEAAAASVVLTAVVTWRLWKHPRRPAEKIPESPPAKS